MRFMVIVKANADSEAGVMPSEQLLTEMTKFNEELVKAGVMLAGEGLHPSSKGARVKLSGGEPTVTDGPFAETKELIAGYWLWNVSSMEEAVEWVKRCPNPMPEDSDIEIRPVFEAEDFGKEFTPELREQEEAVRAIAENKDEAEIRRLISQWSRALEAKDLDGLTADYAPDAVLYDAIPPYKAEGVAADMTKTITLRTVSCGTEIEILHEGIPAAIPAEMCYLSWQESLVQLANLVEQ